MSGEVCGVEFGPDVNRQKCTLEKGHSAVRNGFGHWSDSKGKAQSGEVRKVVVVKNAVGYGHDTYNSAVFGTRFKFPEMWNRETTALALAVAGPEYVAILDLPGVVSAQVFSTASLYDVAVRKATAYSWAEIEPHIVYLLEQRHDRLAAELVAQAMDQA